MALKPVILSRTREVEAIPVSKLRHKKWQVVGDRPGMTWLPCNSTEGVAEGRVEAYL